MSRNNDRRNARRQNNGGWQQTSSTNKVAAKATTMAGGEDPTQLTAVESFLRKGAANRLSDTSSACSLGELQTWILKFERNLEQCPSPGANDLYQCFVNGTPFNELTVKARIYESAPVFYPPCGTYHEMQGFPDQLLIGLVIATLPLSLAA